MHFSSAVIEAEYGDYLTCDIPVGARKVEPRVTRDRIRKEYLYFVPGAETSRENLIAIELVDHELVVKRGLLKDRLFRSISSPCSWMVRQIRFQSQALAAWVIRRFHRVSETGVA